MHLIHRLFIAALVLMGYSVRAQVAADVVTTINFGNNAGCPGLRLGDLDGDGRLDLVMGQPMTQPDAHTPQLVVRVTAYNLKGVQLWQYSAPEATVFTNHNASSDIPIQVYDFDGDGAAEVIAAFSSKELTILNGKDGKVKRTVPLPMGMSKNGVSGATDCIQIANLRGTPYPQDFIVKTRYSQQWGINGVTGEILWTHKKNPQFTDTLTHFGYAFDSDGNGTDEYVSGFDFLSGQGKILWTAKGLTMHLDAISVGDVDNDPTNGIEIAMASQIGALYSSQGKELWRDNHTTPGGEGIQQIAIGDFNSTYPGKEIVMLERIGPRDATGRDGNILVTSKGELIKKELRSGNDYGWLSVTERITNWDGKGTDQIITFRRTSQPATIFDGNLKPLVTFPHSGSDSEFLIHADLCGDAKEEVILYNATTAWIYANGVCDLNGPPAHASLPQNRRLYNATVYSGWDAVDYQFYTPGSVTRLQIAKGIVPDAFSIQAQGNKMIFRSLGVFGAGREGFFQLRILNARGQAVAQSGLIREGEWIWKTDKTPHGLYFIELRNNGKKLTSRFVLR